MIKIGEENRDENYIPKLLSSSAMLHPDIYLTYRPEMRQIKSPKTVQKYFLFGDDKDNVMDKKVEDLGFIRSSEYKPNSSLFHTEIEKFKIYPITKDL